MVSAWSRSPLGGALAKLAFRAQHRELLGDGEFHHTDDIVQRVQQKVGPGARSFTIIGMMKPPDFEREGDRFRLKA